MTGWYSGASDFNPGAGISGTTTIAGYYELYAAFYDDNGNYIYSMSIGSPGTDYGYGLAIDSTSGFYLAGQFIDSMDCDPGTGTAYIHSPTSTDYNLYIAKYSQPLINSILFHEKSEQLSLYPSPTDGILFVQTKSIGAIQSVSITNMNGQVLLQKNKTRENSINVSELSAGIYFVTVVTDGERVVGRFVKN
jgi:hypothetical protein